MGGDPIEHFLPGLLLLVHREGQRGEKSVVHDDGRNLLDDFASVVPSNRSHELLRFRVELFVGIRELQGVECADLIEILKHVVLQWLAELDGAVADSGAALAAELDKRLFVHPALKVGKVLRSAQIGDRGV